MQALKHRIVKESCRIWFGESSGLWPTSSTVPGHDTLFSNVSACLVVRGVNKPCWEEWASIYTGEKLLENCNKIVINFTDNFWFGNAIDSLLKPMKIKELIMLLNAFCVSFWRLPWPYNIYFDRRENKAGWFWSSVYTDS